MPVAGICQPMMHRHGKMGATPTSDAVTCEQHCCLRVGAALDLFYFILLLLLFFFYGFMPARFRFTPIWPELSHFYHIRSYWLVAETDQNSQKMPKSFCCE